MATVNDIPTQYKPFFKAISKGTQRMIDIVFDATATPDQKLIAISSIAGLINNDINRIEHYVRIGVTDAEAEMDAAIAKPLV
jgi:hypothetical protein